MLLPIVIRELRVSARNRATHRLRLLFAVGAVTIGGGLGLISAVGGGLAGNQFGLWIFEALKWIAFIFACGAGVFLTSDCLSEEKREGTLGLLFLTDLRGHDFVLGKLLATSLRTFYSLLAIFPVMALSFVLGGVAVDDFWQTLLSLCNALFFSLALGMVISAVSRDSHKAMTAALAAMALILFLFPALDNLLPGLGAGTPCLSLLSPFYAFTNAGYSATAHYWWSMILVHLAAWGCLGLASWLAPKTWREKIARPASVDRLNFPWIGRASAAASESRKLRDQNPICWIISRDRWAASLARLAIFLVLVVFALSLIALFQGRGQGIPAALPIAPVTVTTTTMSNSSTTVVTTSSSASGFVGWSTAGASTMSRGILFIIASSCAAGLSIALELWLASHVCRFYVEGRRNGFLELLWVTPTTTADICHGHWLALRRLFLAPALAQLFLTLACGLIQTLATSSTLAAVTAGGKASPLGSGQNVEIGQFVALALGAVSWSLGLFTLVWFSIWMGITSNKIPLAVLKTFWYAKILPQFGMSFLGGMLVVLVMVAGLGTGAFGAGVGAGAIWIFPVAIQLLFIGVNIALIFFARRRAQTAFAKWSATSLQR
jgi:ABC-type transport system involved in cytochrome c biogenesis permease component